MSGTKVRRLSPEQKKRIEQAMSGGTEGAFAKMIQAQILGSLVLSMMNRMRQEGGGSIAIVFIPEGGATMPKKIADAIDEYGEACYADALNTEWKAQRINKRVTLVNLITAALSGEDDDDSLVHAWDGLTGRIFCGAKDGPLETHDREVTCPACIEKQNSPVG